MTPTILIAAGGTGGHIYPALAIAKALQVIRPEIRIEFVGTPTGLENQLVPREGYTVNHISIGRLNSNVPRLERLKTVALLPWAMMQSLLLVWRRKPLLVLGVGGHASGPLVLAAALLRKKTFIWEPNAHPGLANRILAPFVSESLVVFNEAAKLLRTRRVHHVGMPVRDVIEQMGFVPTRMSAGLRVLVFGGSQGARQLNTVVADAINSGGDWLKDIEFVHQTGPADFPRISGLYKGKNGPVEVLPYLHDMEKRYLWADIIVSRSGSGTVSELAACGKAAILVPLESAANQHQQRNAEALVAAGAAEMILQKDFTTDHLAQVLTDYKNHREKIDLMSKNIQKFHRPYAGREIAQYLLETLTH